ncbi:MAG: TolB-like protein [Lysobacterales bacterium]|jgi:TolB-like protein
MNFFTELKRRNVFRVAFAYSITGWLIAQIAGLAADSFGAPGWVMKMIITMLLLGFPVAMVMAWAYDLTPDGLRRDAGDEAAQSASKSKLDHTITFVLVVALAYFAYDKFVLNPQRDVVTAQSTQQASNESGATAEPSESLPHEKSIAVLPFANRSNLEDDLYFTDGIHDDLLTQLAKIDDLKVISRTSVMEYRDTSKKIPEIAAELGVATILEGGVQRAGQRIRINAQLIDVSTDEHLWAETFDREMTVENIFEIQSEIARQIVTAVRGELSSEETEILAQFPTQSLEAYEAYMHAKAAIHEAAYTADKYLRAQEWAEKAVALDPDFIWAWALLVDAHSTAVWLGFDPTPERVNALKFALEQTMSKDPESAVAQTALGDYLYRIEADYIAALAAYKKTSFKQPGNAHAMYQIAATQRRIGQFNESIASFEKALRLDPANPEVTSEYLLTLMFNTEYEKGVPLAEKAIQRFPQEDILKSHLAFMYIHWKGDLLKARELLNEMSPSAGFEFVTLATRLPLFERDFSEALSTWDLPEVIQFSEYQSNPSGWRGRVRGEIHQLLGKHDEATNILNEFVANQNAREVLAPKGRALKLINIALAYALTGKSQEALETMAEARSIISSISDSMAGAAVDGLAARILALVGQDDEALQEIERLIDTPASRLTRWTLTLDPRWDFFRSNERFNELIRPENATEARQ